MKVKQIVSKFLTAHQPNESMENRFISISQKDDQLYIVHQGKKMVLYTFDLTSNNFTNNVVLEDSHINMTVFDFIAK